MIHLNPNRSARPCGGYNIILAVVVLLIFICGLETARRAHNDKFSANEPLQEARHLSARELLARPLASDLSSFPKIFHQSWSTASLPKKFEEWSQSCRRAHPDWEWVLWTDEDNLRLVQKYAPWYMKTYIELGTKLPVARADVVRNLYMHVFGGVYADLDVECLQPTESLLDTYGRPGRQAFLGRMGTDNESTASLPNAWFASTPGHPFWLSPLEYTQKNIDKFDTMEALTGPGSLFLVVEDYNNKSSPTAIDAHYAESEWRDLFPPSSHKSPGSEDLNLTILPFWEIYPYSWRRDGRSYTDYCWTRAEKFNSSRCQLLLGTEHWGSHTITYWSHSWGASDGHDEKGMKSITG